MPHQESAVSLASIVQSQDIWKTMLVQEALEAAGVTGASLQQVLGALETRDFAPEMPADAAFANFDLSRHLVHLSPRLQGYIIAAQQQAAGQGASQTCIFMIVHLATVLEGLHLAGLMRLLRLRPSRRLLKPSSGCCLPLTLLVSLKSGQHWMPWMFEHCLIVVQVAVCHRCVIWPASPD